MLVGELDAVGFLGKRAGGVTPFADGGGVGEQCATVVGDDGDEAVDLVLFVIRHLIIARVYSDGREVGQLT